MAVEVTDVTEEYLEAIYRLQQLNGVARTSEIVKMMRVVPGTVTNTMKRLQRDGLITRKPYKGVKLTERGLRIALDVIRRHRLSERLLTDILQVEWAEAHEAACGIEHGLTEDITSNLESVLGHPTTCPHGNPIPTKSGDIIEGKSKILTRLNPQERGVIKKIEHEESDILRYLNTLNLKPGTLVKVIEKAPFNGPITIAVNGKTLALGRNIATKIWIRKE
jgi:DtxR family Mn-dependent transcriptional regulator